MKNIVVRNKETGVGRQETGVGRQQTLRKAYTAPAIEVVMPAGESVLYTASPGVGSGYDPSLPFEAPKHDLDIEFRDVWEE